MPIQIDSASPALASGADATTVTTASFTRPAGGLLVAAVAAVSTANVTVSGGSLTWTRRVQRIQFTTDRAEIWTAPVTDSGAMTVELGNITRDTETERQGGAIKVFAITGQHPADPIGNSGNDVASTNTLNVTGYTSSEAGSRGFLAAIEFEALGNPTAGGGDTGYPFTVSGTFFTVCGIHMVKAANTAAASTNVTFNADAPGTSSAAWAWSALEILAEPVPPRPVALRPNGAAHRAANW